MAEVPDLPEGKPGGEYTHEWLARFTDTQLSEYRGYLLSEIGAAVDVEPPASVYRSASYRRYRYRQRVAMVDRELARRNPAMVAARKAKLRLMTQDHRRFSTWVTRDLTSNRMRGLYAEWLLADRLGLRTDDVGRIEWDMVDIRFDDLTIEVKTSGTRQQWSDQPSKPRFSIAPQRTSWDAPNNASVVQEVPRRTALVYVFCLHSCTDLTNEAVLSVESWQFWVVPTEWLDKNFPNQKSLGLGGLRKFGHGVHIDRAIEQIKRLAKQVRSDESFVPEQ